MSNGELAKQEVIAYLSVGVFLGIAGFGVSLINDLPLHQCFGWFLAVSVGGSFLAGWLHNA